MSKPVRRMMLLAACSLAALSIGLALERAAIWANSPPDHPSYRENASRRAEEIPSQARSSVSRGIIMRPCQNLESAAASELCAQWRAVAAAERSAAWAWWQMIFSLAGIFGLAVTLWFNHQAWRLAKLSEHGTAEALAIAARNADAAHINARAYVAKERAYIAAHDAFYVQVLDRPIEDAFALSIQNYGQSPATITSVEWEYLDGPVWPDRLRWQSYEVTVLPSSAIDRSEALQADILPDYDDPKWLVGTLHYRSLESVTSETHFCYKIELKPANSYHSARFEASRSTCAGQPIDT